MTIHSYLSQVSKVPKGMSTHYLSTPKVTPRCTMVLRLILMFVVLQCPSRAVHITICGQYG